MASTGEHDSNAVLSDVESEEDPVPILLDTPSPDGFSGERFLQLVASLDRERQARQFAENSFNRLKVLTHEAIKMREDAGRSNERLSEELAEALRAKDDVLKQRDEVAKQLEELVKAKEELRSEIESSARILVTGIEKIGVKVSGYRNFSTGGLPRSPKYSGLPAIAYGFINRTNEIVEDLLNQLEVARKSRNEAREQIEQRNYEIAIEVSQLESTISGLKQQLAKKSLEADNLEKAIAHKDAKIFEMDREMLELRRKGEGYACTVRSLELKMDSQQGLIIDQLNYMSKAQEQLNQIMKMVDANVLDRIELLDSASISNELDENLRYSLDGMMSIHELLKVAVEKVRDGMEERNHEEKGLKDTVTRLVNEKRQIGSLLRSVLSKKMISDPSSKGSNALQVAGNGFRKEGLDLRFSDMGAMEIEVDEVYTLVSSLLFIRMIKTISYIIGFPFFFCLLNLKSDTDCAFCVGWRFRGDC